MEQTTIDFGVWMLAQRRRRGISRGDLAERTNRHRDTIGRYERGEDFPTVDFLAKWADALEVSSDAIGRAFGILRGAEL